MAYNRGTPCASPKELFLSPEVLALIVVDMQKKDLPSSGLTKAQLIDVVYERHGGLTKNEAAEIVNTIFSTVKSSLGSGRPVRITNFGTFEVTARPGRRGVNPTNGESLFIPPHRGLSFRPARRLKSLVSKPGARNERD